MSPSFGWDSSTVLAMPRSVCRTRSATEATTGAGCWSHVTDATFSNWVTEPGLTTSAASVTVKASPGAKVRLVASTGAAAPAAALVPGPATQVLSATYSVPVGRRSSIRMPVCTTGLRFDTAIA